MHDSIRSKLDQDGFVVLDDFLTQAEVEELRTAGVEMTKNMPETDHKVIFSTTDVTDEHSRSEYFVNSNDKIRGFYEVDAIGSDGKLKVDTTVAFNKVGHALHLLHPVFRRYTYSDKVKDTCRQLGLKEPAVVQSMYIYKNPRIGGKVIPHQDVTYLCSEPIPPVGFWFALDEATVQNGCLWMIPGSHKSGVHRRFVRNPEKEPAFIYDRPLPDYPDESYIPVPVKKGTCILIHGNVVHKSAHNTSDKSRHGYTFHIIEKQNNTWSKENWIQEGPGAPHLNIYTTPESV